MKTTVASMGTTAPQAMMKRSRASSRARRVLAAGVVVCAGAVLTVADPALTRSREGAMSPSLVAVAAPPALQDSTAIHAPTGTLVVENQYGSRQA
jgi:hypothetical protein